MSWFDLGAVVVIALAVLDGAKSGVVWAALETALLVGAGLAAQGLRSHVEPYVSKVADLAPEDLHSAAFVVVFALSACMFFGVLILLHPASKRWRFKHDSWYGAVLGLANGALAALLLFSMAIWSTPRPTYEDAVAGSRLVPVLDWAYGHGGERMFPEHVPERLSPLRRP